ncbi:MAG: deacylase [Cupriavidus sp.]|uniref:aminoacyl-tRNA deacylase n=1 Tax=Cupriavidus pauculus TaxID=82633 RepID=UPI000783BA46|nr:YbaK/EbsC family protein [Cupriavidus pauculus]MBU66190.1 deacylase [Cupriavidus sp.]KAB0600139.1 YbaK/EbsC family protein [Cupriavidus pauculus]MBY4733172.1 YbaK/EbsC family protein [Cupriavidus pauculus]MCM3607538.1 YbaK/EbsC family protein [Cupriavidus pauculus]UAL01785.1 YbaK/EbsC family protein [Cupriavidus pauculus]
MAMAGTLAGRLSRMNSQFDIIRHPYSLSSMATAQAAHVPGNRLAKTVLLEDEAGYVAAVIPSSHHLQMAAICAQTGRQLVLAHEDEIREVFKDCDLGAIPPCATSYGMRTYVDESLLEEPEIWFEAGDHMELVHMDREQFMNLMSDAERGRFSHRMM